MLHQKSATSASLVRSRYPWRSLHILAFVRRFGPHCRTFQSLQVLIRQEEYGRIHICGLGFKDFSTLVALVGTPSGKSVYSGWSSSFPVPAPCISGSLSNRCDETASRPESPRAQVDQTFITSKMPTSSITQWWTAKKRSNPPFKKLTCAIMTGIESAEVPNSLGAYSFNGTASEGKCFEHSFW